MYYDARLGRWSVANISLVGCSRSLGHLLDFNWPFFLRPFWK